MSEASQLPIIASLVLACVVLAGIVVVQALRGRKGNSLSGTDNLSAELTRMATSLDPMDEAAPSFLNFAKSLITKGYSRDRAVIDAFSQVLASHTRLQEQLFSSQQRLSAQARQMDSHVTEARTDALTHVANRRALDDFLLEAAEKHKTEGTSCSMMLVDVDYFKKCNDTYGHHAGDEVLRQVAAILKHHADGRALVARYGGEEFAIVAVGVPRLTICQMAEHLRGLVGSAVMRFESKQLRVTISAGLAELQHSEDMQRFSQRVDEALYASKRGGRNCCHWHDGTETTRIKSSPASEPGAAIPEGVGALLGGPWMSPALAQFDNLAQDPVAQVSSRPAFLDDLIRRLAQWRRERGQSPISLMLAQVDEYEKFTKEGADVANLVIRTTSKVFKACMREMDHVTRMNDNTFAILMPGVDLTTAGNMGERVRKTILRTQLPKRLAKTSFTVTIGAVEVNEKDDMNTLLDRSSAALATAINHGRNCVHKGDAVRAPAKR